MLSKIFDNKANYQRTNEDFLLKLTELFSLGKTLITCLRRKMPSNTRNFIRLTFYKNKIIRLPE